MKKIIAIAILFFNVVCLASCFSQELKTTLDSNEIRIVNKQNKILPETHKFVGVNWLFENKYNHLFLSNPSDMDSLASTLRKFNVDTIRFPGGVNIGDFFWDQPNDQIYKALVSHYQKCNLSYQEKNYRSYLVPSDRIDLKTFLTFCKKNGIKVTLQVNTHKYFDPKTNEISFLKTYVFGPKGQRNFFSADGTNTGVIDKEKIIKAAQNSAEEVTWAYQEGFGDTVAYWELGNEEWMGDNSQPKSVFYTGKEYAYVASEYIKAMKKANPSIKIIITGAAPLNSKPDNKFFVNWINDLITSTLLKGLQNDVFAFSCHIYPFDFSKNYSWQEYYSNLTDPLRSITNITFKEFKERLDKNGFNHSLIFVNEFNSTNYSSQYSHTWLSALGDAKMIIRFLNSPLAVHSDFHEILSFYGIYNNTYKGSGMALFHYAKDYKTPFMPLPPASVISLLNQNIQKDVLTSESNNSEVYTATTKDNTAVKTIILNFNTAKTILLNFAQFKQLNFVKDNSIGQGVKENFMPIDLEDSFFNPSEYRMVNVLTNKLNVKSVGQNSFKVILPGNTLTVLDFKEQNN